MKQLKLEFTEKCIRCGCDGAKRRRQFTAYVNDEMNFAVLCDECQEEASEYWMERWNEYYGSVL
jgi:hypothetical protein